MAARVAWTLNLDADLELAAGPGYAPKQSVLRAMGPHVKMLAASLLEPDDMLVDESSPAGTARGLPGRAFCPTPRADAILRRAGAEPEPHPAARVLRTVNSRAFSQSLGPTLPGARFVTNLEEALEMLRSEPRIAEAWRIKRAYGMAGRGHRVVGPRDDLAFLGRWLTDGGVQIEPNVSIDREYALHGMLAESGAMETGEIVLQRCDAQGAWLATERIEPDALADLAGLLLREAHDVGAALHAAGYFGPFGIDAFTYRDRSGTPRFQPRSEINARYSMGYGIGFRRSRSPL